MKQQLKKEDDYLVCHEYTERADQLSGKHPDFICFYHEMTMKFYFAWMDASWNVLMRSEGYPTIAARDHGIETVIRNRSHRNHFKLVEGHGAYFLCLIADNHQEIARSCPKKTTEEAWALISQEEYSGKPPIVEYVKHINKNINMNEDAFGYNQENDEGGMDKYLPCREYKGHHINDKVNNVSLFRHANGKYYFVIYKPDGSVCLRSEGFDAAESRDIELAEAIKGMEIPERFTSIEDMGYLTKILKDPNGREVGRSCPEKI